MPITRLDLSTPQGQQEVWNLLATLPVKYVHMGPPCGTYSRAREKRIPKWALRKGASNPQPLRSERYPEGLPFLKGTAEAKVATANILANFSARVATHCSQHSIGFTVENPARSLLWLMPEIKILLADKTANMVVLTACMWGSRRNKKTCIFTNIPGISDMGIPCDGKHEHLPWGIRYSGGWSFATAEECEYPIEMCMVLALRAAKNGSLRTDGDLTVIKARTKPSLETLQARAAVGAQPRGVRLPQVILEHVEVITISVHKPQLRDIAAKLSGTLKEATYIFEDGSSLPIGTKVLENITVRESG